MAYDGAVGRTILLYGDMRADRLGASYRRAFEELGHTVVPVDSSQITQHLRWWLRDRVMHRLTIKSLGARRRGTTAWNDLVVGVAAQHRPDLVLVLNGEFLMPETFRRLQALGAHVALFHSDNPFPPHYANRPETLPSARQVDTYLIWSERIARHLEATGVRRACYLPFAWDHEVFPFQGLASHWDHDVVFIGGWAREREELLDAVARRFPLKIWGPPYWATRTRLGSRARRAWQGRALTGPQAAQVAARAKIVLNPLRMQHSVDGAPDGVIMRTFEIPGCGGFLLATRSREALNIFPEEASGAYFGDPEEAIAQIERYLGDPERRVAIARAAHELVARQHRYEHRAAAILESCR